MSCCYARVHTYIHSRTYIQTLFRHGKKISGYFPDKWKVALVSSLLKKPGMLSEFTNLRPISTLQYLSNLTERVIFNQMHSRLTEHGLCPLLLSAYRRCHSTETALLQGKNDVLMNMDYQRATIRFKYRI